MDTDAHELESDLTEAVIGSAFEVANAGRRENPMTIAAAVLTTAVLVSAALAGTVNFDNLKTGVPPPGWTATQTGRGAAKWTTEQDHSAPSKPNVLKQSGQAAHPVVHNERTSLKLR